MDTAVHFEITQIAACGINCGTCRAHLRDRNKCSGCRASSGPNIPHCSNCKIRNCDSLDRTSSGFCYECNEFPCARINNIDKRYQAKYRTSLIQNLRRLSVTGTEAYLLSEEVKWSCKNCGAVLSVHNTSCLKCGKEY
jgi:hypothetical protein